MSTSRRVMMVTGITVAVALTLAVNQSRQELATPFTLRFSELPPISVSLSGFADAEPWGRWSRQSRARVTFEHRLPAAFTLRLDAKAFGPTATRPLRISIGDQERELRLGESLQRYELVFEGVERTSTIFFHVSRPVSPRELGIGDDSRQLGIGLASLRIEEL